MNELFVSILGAVYIISASAVALFAGLGLITLWAYWRHRGENHRCPETLPELLPSVTVQLPIYNERLVAKRLIMAVAALDYPSDRLEIQILDDSTDETTQIAAKLVEHYRKKGINIKLLHRDERLGFKAGALQQALRTATGELLAVFDADFLPQPEFLSLTVPHFLDDPELGMIQTRWGHLNNAESTLTAVQAIALDKHFVMEQSARHRAKLYPKFNGSGGIWRAQCVREVGGWQSDTLCEDLCLSTRATLCGWKSRFLTDVVAPAELPTTLSAFKNQQARWAAGSTQCLIKFGGDILSDSRNSPIARFYALLSLGGYLTFPFILLLLLVQVPLVILDYQPPTALLGLAVVGLGQPLLFVLGQKLLYRDWLVRLRHLPTLLLVGVGLAPVYSRAIGRAISQKSLPFVRTPKSGHPPPEDQRLARGWPMYSLPSDGITSVELALAIYATVGVAVCLLGDRWGPLPFLTTCALGLGYVYVATLKEQRWSSKTP